MKSVLVVGATSAIAEATARIYAANGDRIYLLARNQDRLEVIKRDLQVRGADAVYSARFEALDFDSHAGMVDSVFQELTKIDIVLIAHGSLPDQQRCQKSASEAREELEVNAIGTISILTYLSNILESQKFGVVAVITSVAGDRGRKSNYVYGAAKGMLSIFLQGLRNRLFDAGVVVVDIKPGFVETPMTESFSKGALWASPSTVARCVVDGIERKKHTVYAPGYWRVIMFLIRAIPEAIFKRLNL